MPATEAEAEARRLATADAQRAFDLRRAPLLRASLLRLSNEHHILLLNLHHIVTDGWSMGVLYRELAALYRAFNSGEEPRLPELPVQYADFAVWQRHWLQGEVLEGHLNYWREQLAGASPTINLPTDHPRPAVEGFRGATSFSAVAGDVVAVVERVVAAGRGDVIHDAAGGVGGTARALQR